MSELCGTIRQIASPLGVGAREIREQVETIRPGVITEALRALGNRAIAVGCLTSGRTVIAKINGASQAITDFNNVVEDHTPASSHVRAALVAHHSALEDSFGDSRGILEQVKVYDEHIAAALAAAEAIAGMLGQAREHATACENTQLKCV